MKNTGKENQNNLDPVVISPLKNTLRKILWVLKEIAIALFIAFLITHFVACRGVVVGHSMDNTLYDGENFIVDRFSYNISEPQRFDIVVIEHPRLGCIRRPALDRARYPRHRLDGYQDEKGHQALQPAERLADGKEQHRPLHQSIAGGTSLCRDR